MYEVVVGQGWVSPVDFWRMAPGEVWWLIEARMPQDVIDRNSNVEGLYQMLEEAEAKDGV